MAGAPSPRGRRLAALALVAISVAGCVTSSDPRAIVDIDVPSGAGLSLDDLVIDKIDSTVAGPSPLATSATDAGPITTDDVLPWSNDTSAQVLQDAGFLDGHSRTFRNDDGTIATTVSLSRFDRTSGPTKVTDQISAVLKAQVVLGNATTLTVAEVPGAVGLEGTTESGGHLAVVYYPQNSLLVSVTTESDVTSLTAENTASLCREVAVQEYSELTTVRGARTPATT